MATLQFCCFALVVAGSVAASGGTEGVLETWVMRFGALGLVAFMVVQNYRQARTTNKVLERKDTEIADAHYRLANLTAQQTDAMNRLSKALEDRPCITGRDHLIAGQTST